MKKAVIGLIIVCSIARAFDHCKDFDDDDGSCLACEHGYRTLTNSDGKIADCYVIHCNKDEECGVFETCVHGNCECSYTTRIPPDQNTTCQGKRCWNDDECGAYQQCAKFYNRCKCTHGIITLSNRTTVCINPNSCIDDKDCDKNGYCWNNTCQCMNGFLNDSDNQGKFKCKETTSKSLNLALVFGITAGVTAFTALGIFLLWYYVKRFLRQRQRTSPTVLPMSVTPRRYLPPPLRASTMRLLNNDHTLLQEHRNATHKPDDDSPPAYADQPPSYEAAATMFTTHS